MTIMKITFFFLGSPQQQHDAARGVYYIMAGFHKRPTRKNTAKRPSISRDQTILNTSIVEVGEDERIREGKELAIFTSNTTKL